MFHDYFWKKRNFLWIQVRRLLQSNLFCKFLRDVSTIILQDDKSAWNTTHYVFDFIRNKCLDNLKLCCLFNISKTKLSIFIRAKSWKRMIWINYRKMISTDCNTLNSWPSEVLIFRNLELLVDFCFYVILPELGLIRVIHHLWSSHFKH